MKVTVNLAHLYETDRALFNQIKRHVNGRISGTETIDIPIAFGEAVKRWQEKNPEELWQEQVKQAEKDARKAQAEKDQAAALKQYAFWIQNGMENTAANHEAIAKWIDDKAPYVLDGKGYLCAENIDAAIRALGPGGAETLAWKKAPVEPVAPTPPVEPPSPPVLLDDPEAPGGKSEQLPLGTQPRHRHTKVQLKDLARRDQEAKQQQLRAHNNEVASKFNKPITIEVGGETA